MGWISVEYIEKDTNFVEMLFPFPFFFLFFSFNTTEKQNTQTRDQLSPASQGGFLSQLADVGNK